MRFLERLKCCSGGKYKRKEVQDGTVQRNEVKDDNGKMFCEEKDVERQWTQYFEKLMSVKNLGKAINDMHDNEKG